MAFAGSDAHAGVRAGWRALSAEWAYYHALKHDGSAPHAGLTMGAMLKTLRLDGQPEEAAWPYVAELFTDMTAWTPPNAKPVFRRESTPQTATVEAIIACIDADNPVLFTMSISRSFYSPATGGLIDGTEPVESSRVHALVAVGHGYSQQGTFLLVRNSWGRAWGNNGYGWVATGYLKPRLLRAAIMAGEI